MNSYQCVCLLLFYDYTTKVSLRNIVHAHSSGVFVLKCKSLKIMNILLTIRYISTIAVCVFSLACWVVYLCPCTIACLPAVGQEFHQELVKQQESRGSRGNGHKTVPLTAAISLLPNALLFSFLCLPHLHSLICSRLLCNFGPTSGIDC